MTTDREILLSAEAKARQMLTASASNAAGLLARSDEDAAADLIREQEFAAQLLLQESAQAIEAARDIDGSTQGLSDAEVNEYREQTRLEAEALRIAHKRTASELAKVEKALAARVGEAMAAAAVDILMDGHRAAAAILLEARMRVADKRTETS